MHIGKTISVLIVIMTIGAGINLITPGADVSTGESGESVHWIEEELETSDRPVVRYLSTNLTAFEFPYEGDGYIVKIEQQGGSSREVKCLNVKGTGGIKQTAWPNNISAARVLTDDLDAIVHKFDSNGVLALKVTYSGEDYIAIEITVTVISYGISQSVYYRYWLKSVDSDSYAISWVGHSNVGCDGLIDVKATLSKNDVVLDDISDYRFYTSGLYRGVSILSDSHWIYIRGRIDASDERWFSEYKMRFNIIITNTSDNFVASVGMEFYYLIEPSPDSLSYVVKTPDAAIHDYTVNKTMSVLEGTPLSVEVSNGTEVTVFYENGNEVSTKHLFPMSDETQSADLITRGSGKYSLLFKNSGVPDSPQDTVIINVIASLIPSNSIRVRCGPAQ